PELADVPPPAPAMPAHVIHDLRVEGSARLWPLVDVMRHARLRAIQGAIEISYGENATTMLIDGPFIRWCEPHSQGAFTDFGSVLVATGVVSEEDVVRAQQDPSNPAAGVID